MKPQSYPFLAIAKSFNVRYADVLKHADAFTHHRGEHIFVPGSRIERAIILAVCEFKQIQNGRIDWITGEKK